MSDLEVRIVIGRIATVLVLAAAEEGRAADPAQEAPAAVIVTGVRRPLLNPSAAGPLNDDAAEAPAQITVVPLPVLQEPGIARISDAVDRDASVGENYAAIGYYPNFSIRGFTLDQGSSYRINGFVVPGEFDIALDDKERVEILKGVTTISAGAASPGGLVNFVTKRPADVMAGRLDLTPRGGRRLAFDYGRATDSPEAFGYRVIASHEEIRPYAIKANGQRNFFSAAVDAAPFPAWTLTGDIEYQQRSQFAVPGVQLLGGSSLPPVQPTSNINQQPWSRPVENQGLFAGARAEHRITQDWRLRLSASVARARIDDNLAFPFGCNDPPFQYFCADGSYVIYDYHSRELRETVHADVSVLGSTASGDMGHRIAAGVEWIARTISQHDYYSNTLLDAAGRGLTGNISDPSIPLPAPPATPTDRADVSTGQRGVYVADEIARGSWRVHGTLRLVQMWQTQYGDISQTQVLPQLAVIRSLSEHSRIYAGWAKGLEFGSLAPLTAENSGQLLPPRPTRQAEIGWKEERREFALSTAAFRMSRPYEFTDPTGNSFAGLGAYRQQGTETHTGLELAGQGRLSPRFQAFGSIAWIDARAAGTGEPAFENVQVQNIPRARSSLYARYALGDAPGWEISGGWIHSSRRNARRDGTVSVPAYDRFDAGVSWTIARDYYRTKLMLAITNLTDSRYWRDASEAYSADLLFPGAPRQIAFALLVEAI